MIRALAKSGILGLSNTLYQEGAKHNILVNTIAPNAGTAMTATVLPPEMVEALKPDYVAPLVAFLSHEECQESGGVFEVGSGWIAKVRRQRSKGIVFPPKGAITPEMIAAKWQQINDFTKGVTYPLTPADSMSFFLERVQSGGDPEAQAAGGKSYPAVPDVRFTFQKKDVILYNLGVGAKREELKWVYENAPDFQAVPTFGVVPSFESQLMVPFDDIIPDFNPVHASLLSLRLFLD